MIEAAMEPIKRVRRKGREKGPGYKLTRIGKRPLKFVHWTRDEVANTPVTVVYGNEEVEIEVPRHKREALEKKIRGTWQVTDF
jgi:hypothetical protein